MRKALARGVGHVGGTCNLEVSAPLERRGRALANGRRLVCVGDLGRYHASTAAQGRYRVRVVDRQ